MTKLTINIAAEDDAKCPVLNSQCDLLKESRDKLLIDMLAIQKAFDEGWITHTCREGIDVIEKAMES